MDSPSTSFHLKNEKSSVQLSLLEHEEDTWNANNATGGTTSQGRLPTSVIIPGFVTKPSPPPKHPPREKVNPFRFISNFVVGLVLTLLFLVCLPILIVVYIFVGLIPRFCVKLLLKCSNGGRFQLLPASRAFGSTNGNHHTVVLVIRGRCDMEHMRCRMMGIITSLDTTTGERRFSHLQQRVAQKSGYLCLENLYSRFDIKNHIKHFDIRRKNLLLTPNDIIPFLETTYDEPFENDGTAPQWEVLVIPKYAYADPESKLLPTSDPKQFYALVFRFHHAIMSWNMFQELLVEFLGKTSGRVRSFFCPPTRLTVWTKLKILLLVPLVGPQGFMRQVLRRWRKFVTIDEAAAPRISMASTKPVDSDAFEDVQSRTFTTVTSVMTSCARIALRNLILGQNLQLPRTLHLSRVFNTMTAALQGVDSLSIDYNAARISLERLQGTFHALEREQGGPSLAAQRMFNKVVIGMAGVLPCRLTASLYATLLKADMVVEMWPGADEPCKIFGEDLVADIFGWAGISGVNADFKATVTTYCGRVRVNFIGRQGFIGNVTDAQILAREFEDEFKKYAATAGLYQSRLFLPPAIEIGS